MDQGKRKGSIILQVAALFLIGVLITGALTYISENRLSYNSVKRQTESHCAEIADQAKRAVLEYPASEWLIRYWYEHPDELEIEYDVDFGAGTQTQEKCARLAAMYPELQLRYAEETELETLSEEAQKLYAEIAYSWLITRIDQLKQACRVDYLFCVISEEPFDRQFFLFSGADPDAVRGTHYEEVYPLGNLVTVGDSQTKAMREATLNASHLADAGNYVDYYSLLCSFDGHTVLIGLTSDLSSLLEDIDTQAMAGTRLASFTHLALSVICLALLFVFVLRPLKTVQGNIQRYKRTKDSEPVIASLKEVRSHNEIGHLAVDLSDMIRELDSHMEKIRTITAEKERIGTELALATRIQAAMLPSCFPPFPDRREFDLYAVMDPAKEVGGDFYDFFLIDDDHLALVMADVSGKGIPAALFMMVSKILVKNTALTGVSPAKVLEAVNRQICDNNPEDMFVTVWLGILEISTGRLTAASAGHEYPVLRHAGGGFELLKDRHGFVIGGMSGMKYRDYELQLKPGAAIFVYTDGVPEATDAENQLFTTDRLLTALNREPDAAPEQLLRNVRRDVDEFVGSAEQFDDLTMLCLEYRGPETADPD
jgi:sigma-B regulation protein RsbU (phosphoserine phosphatase)